MKKIVEIEIKNMQGARKMLELSGCYDANRMTDEEVFEKIMSRIACYCIEWTSIN